MTDVEGKNMQIEKVMVVGAGQMGSGIAQVCAQAGYQVYLNDLKEDIVEKGLEVIRKNLNRQVQKERMNEDEKEGILARFIKSTDLKDAGNADIVIEAAVE